MKIRELNVTPIAISDPPLRNAAGLHAPYALRIVVELVSEDGISGISEIPGSEDTRQALLSAAEVVVGCSPYETTRLWEALESRYGADSGDQRGTQSWDQRKLVHMFSALEVACLDLVGKATDRPVVDLLGAAHATAFRSPPICSSSTRAPVVNWNSEPIRQPPDGQPDAKPRP